MITIPLWIFIILSILAAIGSLAIILVIFAQIRAKYLEECYMKQFIGEKHGTQKDK